MKKGIENGVDLINDVSGLNYDDKSFDLINANSQLDLNIMPAKVGASKLGPVEDEYSLAVQSLVELFYGPIPEE